MAKRGVIYAIWGDDDKHKRALDRSRRSLESVHPELPVEVLRFTDEKHPIYGLAQKAKILSRSPFEETLYLDLDTVVLGRLDYAFEKAGKFGLACCICECPWARRYVGLAARPALIEYNTGVMFFTGAARPVFERWEKLVGTLDSSVPFIDTATQKLLVSRFNDQAAFALAIEETNFNPFILPLNYNFRPVFYNSWFGPLVIWHGYAEIPAPVLTINRHYKTQENPVMQFHLLP